MELTEWEKDGARVRPHGRGDEGCCLHMPGKPGTEGAEAVIRRKRKGYISPVVRTRGTIPPTVFLPLQNEGFRSQFRGVAGIPFFLFRLSKLRAWYWKREEGTQPTFRTPPIFTNCLLKSQECKIVL